MKVPEPVDAGSCSADPARNSPAGTPSAADRGAAAAAASRADQRVGWLIAALVLVALTIVVFAGGLRGVAVDVTVADDAAVSWLGGLHAPGLVGIWRGLAALSSWWALLGLVWGLVLALVVLRRFRHLIVWVIVASLVQVIGAVLAAIGHRPRPFGVEIRTDWGGYATVAAGHASWRLGWWRSCTP